jgi:hypothetical protein
VTHQGAFVAWIYGHRAGAERAVDARAAGAGDLRRQRGGAVRKERAPRGVALAGKHGDLPSRPRPPSARGYRRGRREEPAPRYRLRRDDGRERIDTPAADALCKAGTRSTAEGSGRPGGGTAQLMDGPKAGRASACSKRDACAPPARTPTFSSMREQQQRRSVGLRRIGRRHVASDLRPGGPTKRPGSWPLERNTAYLDWHEPAPQLAVALLGRMNARQGAAR